MTRTLRSRCLTRLLPLFLILMLCAPTAQAGSDDFEFGQALAKKGKATGDKYWFDLARKVYERILSDGSRDANDKNEARYGIAELVGGEALAAAARRSVPYADVKAAFERAVEGMEEFVSKNPKHPKILAAKLAVGETRLAFVTWARDLLDDSEAIEARGTDTDTVQADARRMVSKAIEYFDELDDGWDGDEPTDEQALAHYSYVTCLYYAARVLNPCSTPAINALAKAAEALDEFINFFDGTMVAVYAMDFLGLTDQERADCEQNEDLKVGLYQSAYDWFESCTATEWVDADSLRIIARGYYHLGRCCNQAGRVGDQNFYKKGAVHLRKMTSRIPTIVKTADGIRAMLQLAELEFKLDNSDQAIEVASEAGKHAGTTGRPWLENQANRLITKILESGDGGDGGSTVSPDILKRVADNQYAQKNWRAAIGAYQKVILACTDTKEDLLNYEIPSWKRLADSYRQLGDLLGAALAAEPVHAAWLDGRIERKAGDSNDANLLLAGGMRRKAMKDMEELFLQTESPVHGDRFKAMRDTFGRDYADHSSAKSGDWNAARDYFREALRLRKSGDSKWKATLAKAEGKFTQVSKNPKAERQHEALVYLMRAASMRKDWRGVEKIALDALKFWESDAVKAQIKEFETVGPRVRKCQGQAKVWLSMAYIELKQPAKAIPFLETWGKEYGGDIRDSFYAPTALGNLVEAYIAMGDIENGLRYHARLLSEFPKYFRLPNITFGLAKYYERQYADLAEPYKGLVIKLRGNDEEIGVVTKRNAAEKEADRIRNRLGDLRGKRDTLQRGISTWEAALEESKKLGKPVEVKGYSQRDYDAAKLELNGDPSAPAAARRVVRDGILKTIERLSSELNAKEAEAENLDKEVTEATREMRDLEQKMYEPLVKAANLYYEWNKVVSPEDRTVRNVSTFAYRFYYATVLNGKDEQNWQRARELYESLLTMSGLSADQKADTSAKLGRIYSHLSGLAKDEQAKQDLVLKAIELLQAGVARNPENNQLVIGVLSNDYAVLPYKSKIQERSFLIPMRHVKDVPEFRKALGELGTPAALLPKYETEAAQKSYERMIGEFKKVIGEWPDKKLKRTVSQFEGAGFDAGFYKAYGNRNRDFRLSLARAWSQSGRPEDGLRAINLCQTLTDSSFAFAETEEGFWEAQEIRLRAYMSASKGMGKEKAEPKDMLEFATKNLRALYLQNPSLGTGVRDVTKDNLKALLKDLDQLRRSAGMSDSDIDLDAPPAGGSNIGTDSEKAGG